MKVIEKQYISKFVYALVNIKLRFWKLFFFVDFHQSYGQQIIS